VIRGGRYRLTTVNADDGALPGTYKVTIEPRPGGEAPTLPALYAGSKTTPLMCEIRASRNTIDIELKD